MQKRTKYGLGCLLCCAPLLAYAQTAVTTSGGAIGQIPVYNGTATLGNSGISISYGNIGIGTSAPSTPLSIMVPISSGSSMAIYGGYSSTSANAAVTMGKIPFMEVIGAEGNSSPSVGLIQLGINAGGTFLSPASIYLGATRAVTAAAAGTTPVANGDILGQVAFYGDDGTSLRTRAAFINAQVYTANGSVSPANVPAELNLATSGAGPIIFYTNIGGSNDSGVFGNANEKMRLDYNGNLGIGTSTPGAKLEVNGNIKLTAKSGASITFSDGTVQSTAYTGVACGGDYAESVNVAGKKKSYEPGDVLVLTADGNADVAESQKPYSTMVAGIYSTKPGYIGRRQSGDPHLATTEVPMAMVGIVPTKVSAENGAVHRGDLLVSSSRVGYAMKGTDRSRMLGAVIGKAMGTLDSGTGVMEVLVTLQ
jgi:hypothetical protein